MDQEILQAIVAMWAIGNLTYYETHRKFKMEKVKGVNAILREWPRVLFTVAIVPGAGKVVLEVIERLAN